MNVEEYQRCFNSKLLDTLEKAMTFFESNDIKFWLSFGSAIGAVRHKGFIPWDDDIDIIMLRDDYNKLFLLNKELSEKDLAFVSYHDRGYYFPFGKIFNKQTTLWEKEDYPFLIGVYIDIFPLDRTNLSDSQILKQMYDYNKLMYRYLRSIRHIHYRGLLNSIKEGRLHDFLSQTITKIMSLTAEKKYRDFSDFEKSLNLKEGNRYVLFGDEIALKNIYDVSWFDETEYVDFENLKVPLPAGNHEILKAHYGDYMTPPPVEEQKLSHDFLRHYINLKESLSMEEVLLRLSQGKKYEF